MYSLTGKYGVRPCFNPIYPGRSDSMHVNPATSAVIQRKPAKLLDIRWYHGKSVPTTLCHLLSSYVRIYQSKSGHTQIEPVKSYLIIIWDDLNGFVVAYYDFSRNSMLSTYLSWQSILYICFDVYFALFQLFRWFCLLLLDLCVFVQESRVIPSFLVIYSHMS